MNARARIAPVCRRGDDMNVSRSPPPQSGSPPRHTDCRAPPHDAAVSLTDATAADTATRGSLASGLDNPRGGGAMMKVVYIPVVTLCLGTPALAQTTGAGCRSGRGRWCNDTERSFDTERGDVGRRHDRHQRERAQDPPCQARGRIGPQRDVGDSVRPSRSASLAPRRARPALRAECASWTHGHSRGECGLAHGPALTA